LVEPVESRSVGEVTAVVELFVSSVTGEDVDGPVSAVVLVTGELTVVKVELVLGDMVVD